MARDRRQGSELAAPAQPHGDQTFSKNSSLLAYYRGVRSALIDHFDRTRAGVQALEVLKPKQIAKIIADLEKQHYRLLDRVDRRIAEAVLAQKNKQSGK